MLEISKLPDGEKEALLKKIFEDKNFSFGFDKN